MPRVIPHHASTTSQLKKTTSPSPLGRTRDGRITKPYIVHPNSKFREILEHDSRINRASGWIKNAGSKIRQAGEGAYAERSFRSSELIGRFRGHPVYELEVAGQSVCIFTIEQGQVRFLKDMSHAIWSGEITKELSLPVSSDSPPETINLNYGIQAEGKLSKINYKKKQANVVAKTYFDESCSLGATTDGRILIDPDKDFRTCVAVALHAKKYIKKDTELYLNYMPECEESIDFEAMDNIPPPSLTTQQVEALLCAARNIEPDNERFRTGTDWLYADDTDSDSGISMESDELNSHSLDITPPSTPIEEAETFEPPPPPLEKRKSARWFGIRCSIQ